MLGFELESDRRHEKTVEEIKTLNDKLIDIQELVENIVKKSKKK